MNIKKIIRETIDDFDWVDKSEYNPWDNYGYIEIDVAPKQENLELLVNLALKTNYVTGKSKEDWAGNMTSNIEDIMDYFYGDGRAYIRLDDGDLWYGYSLQPYGKWAKYSEIFGGDINESQDNTTGLEWIMEIEPYDISNKNWIIHFDVDCDLDEVRRIQEWIYSQGFIWNGDTTIEEMSTDCDSIYYFREYTDDIQFDAYLKWNQPLKEKIDMGFVMYKWSDIRGTLQINESEDDITNLEWIIKSQPIDLDETVKKYVDQGYVVAIWFGDMGDDLRTYVNNFIIKEKFYWSSHRQDTAWIYGNTFKGITFYPSRAMGGFHGVNARENWDGYHESTINREYEDIDPDKFISIEL